MFALDEPVETLTLVPPVNDVLIELANIVLVAPGVKVAVYAVPEAPLAAMVTSNGSNNQVPESPFCYEALTIAELRMS